MCLYKQIDGVEYTTHITQTRNFIRRQNHSFLIALETKKSISVFRRRRRFLESLDYAGATKKRAIARDRLKPFKRMRGNISRCNSMQKKKMQMNDNDDRDALCHYRALVSSIYLSFLFLLPLSRGPLRSVSRLQF